MAEAHHIRRALGELAAHRPCPSLRTRQAAVLHLTSPRLLGHSIPPRRDTIHGQRRHERVRTDGQEHQ
jgi:hypothetical protein